MTKEELAAIINGREYCEEISDAEELAAKADRLVAIFGASDDIVELRGAIYDEASASGGSKVLITRGGKLLEPVDRDDEEVLKKHDMFEILEARRKSAICINAKWAAEGYSWFIETEVPHATFDVMEDGAKFCRGIVIDLKELAA